MKLSLAVALMWQQVQCGSMEAKALSCVLHTAGNKHHRYIVNQARVYVCSGGACGNERDLLFFARYEETWPYPIPYSSRVESSLLNSTVRYATLRYSALSTLLALFFSTLLFSISLYSILLFSTLLFSLILKLRDSEVSHPNFLW